MQSSSRVSVVDNDVTPSATGIFGVTGGEDVDESPGRVVARTGSPRGCGGRHRRHPGPRLHHAGVVIADNVVSGMRSAPGGGSFSASTRSPPAPSSRGNVLRENLDGIVLAPGNHRSTIVGTAHSRTLAPSGNGFRVLVGARENVFTANLALGNATEAGTGRARGTAG